MSKLQAGRCSAQVADHTGFFFHQCQKRARHFENGQWYCGTHAPTRVEARRLARGPTKAYIETQRLMRASALETEVARLRGLVNWAAGRLLDAGDVEGHETVLLGLAEAERDDKG